MFHSIANVDNPLLVHHVVGIFMIVLDKDTMNSREPRAMLFYVKDAIPRAACFESEHTFELLPNCSNFILGLVQIVRVKHKWWKELLENSIGFGLIG